MPTFQTEPVSDSSLRGAEHVRRLVGLAIGVPLLFLALFQLAERLVIERRPLDLGWVASTVGLLLATLAFAIVTVRAFVGLQRQVERLYEETKAQAERVEALREAAVLLTSELDLETVLERVVVLSRQLLNARRATLTVFGRDGSPSREVSAHEDGEEGTGDGEELWQPIRHRDRTIGALHLVGSRPGGFTPADRATAEVMAQQAATAITNAYLLRQEQRLAAVEERQRISMDLHDGTLQSLYAVSLLLEATVPLITSRPEEAQERLNDAVERLARIRRDIRHYIFELGAAPLSLERYVDACAEEFGLATVDKAIDAATWSALGDETRRAALAIAREALANVKRHAGVERAKVELRREGSAAVLVVADDGAGFDPALPVRPGHRGIENMRLRARGIGAELALDSAPGRGTSVRCRFPVRREDG
jgi:signal transduction histidine kinase